MNIIHIMHMSHVMKVSYDSFKGDTHDSYVAEIEDSNFLYSIDNGDKNIYVVNHHPS